MSQPWIYFAVGMVVGGWLGVIAIALCVVTGRSDDDIHPPGGTRAG
jgi:hypothetical protein